MSAGPVFNVITKQRIEEQRALWVRQTEELKARKEALVRESERLAANLLALDGAIQASDAFIRIAETEDTRLPELPTPEVAQPTE